jgi:hypothetical protein
MTTQKKGLYYYIITVLCFLHIVLTATAIWALKHLWDNGQLMTDYVSTLRAVFTICGQFWFIREMLWHDSGYTIITTTEYKLFKCKESGKEEAFMMFADSTEELEHFFEVTEPTKKIYIEEAEMTGKSIQMKVFNGDDVK